MPCSFRWEQSVRVNLLELLLPAKQAVFETATSPICIRALFRVEVTRTFTTPEIFAAGISGSGNCPTFYPLNYGNLRRRQDSNLQLSDPDVTRAFTTPHTLESFPYLLTSLLHYFFRAHPQRFVFDCILRVKNSGRNRRSRSLRYRTRSLSAVTTRSNRELHHPGTRFPRWIALHRNDLGDFCYGRAKMQTARPVRLNVESCWLLSSSLTSASSRSVRIPAKPGRTTEVPQK